MNLDTGFRPSKHGLPFCNDMTFGLCGGFVDLARNLFVADKPVPQRPPKIRIALKQVATLPPSELLKIKTWMVMSDDEMDVATATERKALSEKLWDGPQPLMLIYARYPKEVCNNHQVLAYRLLDGDVMIYDPNQPGNDNVTLASMDARGWYCRS